MRYLVIACLLFSAAVQAHSYCMPEESCWPSASDWQGLASQLSDSDSLIDVSPPAQACLSPESAGCEMLLGQFANAGYRSGLPGGMQMPAWEANGTVGCFVPGEPCLQGAVPVKGVKVHKKEDAVAAINFGRQHNLRVVVKSTGHDYLGRSTAPGSFLIWMHEYTGAKFMDSFTTGCPGASPTTAVHVLGGTQWGEVYEGADSRNVVVVGGNALTVGAAGGYVQGGGHGALSPAFGLAVDNVLEVEIVTADGQIRNASACENPELFFALRGGGGGNWGVIVSIVYKTHPRPALADFTAVVGYVPGVFGSNKEGAMRYFMKLYGQWIKYLDSTQPGKWSGYGLIDKNGFLLKKLFIGSDADAQTGASWIQSRLEARADLFTTSFQYGGYTVRSCGSFMDWHGQQTDETGSNFAIADRLVPTASFYNDTLRDDIYDSIADLVEENGFVTHMLLGGGKVAEADPHHNETSVNPLWRSSLTVPTTGAAFERVFSKSDLDRARYQAWSSMSRLRSLTPDAAYYNEADYYEPNWVESFWGPHYDRLLQVKGDVDPTGVFTCWQCVGGTRGRNQNIIPSSSFTVVPSLAAFLFSCVFALLLAFA